jgi:2-polyprenyl-3-methyl-5-hydroxy-6-metoxy-1,4-benzoquinol methylase
MATTEPERTRRDDRLDWAEEQEGGERFEFGDNWSRFLATVDDDRIEEAERSLREMLERDHLAGCRFLDIGSGSGLFSLAAMRLGADRVHSMDFDPQSVSSTARLREAYFPDEGRWTVEAASVLDRAHIDGLGAWDIVYSWGVLHHTGDLRSAMENAARAVKPGGRLFISIYNDQGTRSDLWRGVKRTYNQLPRALRRPFVVAVMLPFELRSIVRSLIRMKPQRYWRLWTDYRRSRGMSRWHDMVDWVGGYPFEVATPEAVFEFYKLRGFTLTKLKTCKGDWGCNEYVFRRDESRVA